MCVYLSNAVNIGEKEIEVTDNEDCKENDLLIAHENSLEDFKKVNMYSVNQSIAWQVSDFIIHSIAKFTH